MEHCTNFIIRIFHVNQTIHERIIKKNDAANETVVKNSGDEAIEFFEKVLNGQESVPELVFLDINMPKMNGWEFLEVFEKFESSIKDSTVLVMLSTSDNPDDKNRANKLIPSLLSDYRTKPLTSEMLSEIMERNF